MSETPDKMANQNSPTRSLSVTETINGSHLFVIHGYSLAKGMGVGKYISSDEFTVGGYKWAIYFYPDGKNLEDNATYVSVFIALVSDGSDVRAVFGLTLMDQSGKGKHKLHTHFDKSFVGGGGTSTLKSRGSMWGYKRFFRRSMLETSDYLQDDCLKIDCTVGVVVSTIDCPRLPSILVPDSDIGTHIGMLLGDMEGSDIIFNVSGEKIHAHRLVLAARSLKFRSELFGRLDSDEQEILVSNMEPEVFKAMLRFIYTDALIEDELTASNSCSAPLMMDSFTAKLIEAADRYDLGRLKQICESHICKGITVNSVAEVLALSDRYHAEELKNVCLKFAAENLTAVMRSDGFERVKEDCPGLQAEILKTMAGCGEDCSNGGGKSGSVWAQLSDGGDTSGRRVRQRI